MRNQSFSSRTQVSLSRILNRPLSKVEEELQKENEELRQLLTKEKIDKIHMYKELMDSLSREELLVDECEKFERRVLPWKNNIEILGV